MVTSSDGPSKTRTIRNLLNRLLERRYLRSVPDERREELREEVAFIRRVLADQRNPRVAVVGDASLEFGALLESIAARSIDGDPAIKSYLGHERWYDYEFGGKTLELLDLRTESDEPVSLKALVRQPPDVVLFLWGGPESERADARIAGLERVTQTVQNAYGTAPAVTAVVYDDTLPDDLTVREAEQTLGRTIETSTVSANSSAVARANRPGRLASALVESAPVEARLRLTRLVGSAAAKKRLARLIIRAAATLSAGIATIPLPLADFLPITSTQLVMIAAVAYIGGHPFSLKSVAKFATAVGVNVGAGLAARELARAIVQFVPFAGSAVSGSLAAGATVALGNAAITIFIEDETPEAAHA